MDVMPGIASSYIFSLKPGDKVMMSGPYGDFHPIFDSKAEMMWIGGGAGMAPLNLSTTEVIVVYAFGSHTKAVEHIFHSLAHRAGTAHIVFDILRTVVILQVIVIDSTKANALPSCGSMAWNTNFILINI